jgi:hypothetical protein
MHPHYLKGTVTCRLISGLAVQGAGTVELIPGIGVRFRSQFGIPLDAG